MSGRILFLATAKRIFIIAGPNGAGGVGAEFAEEAAASVGELPGVVEIVGEGAQDAMGADVEGGVGGVVL